MSRGGAAPSVQQQRLLLRAGALVWLLDLDRCTQVRISLTPRGVAAGGQRP